MLWALWMSRWASAIGYPLRALRARRLIRPGTFVSLTIDGGVVDLAERRPFFRRGSPAPTAITDVRDLANTIGADPKVRGVLIEIRSLRAGAATATALAEALARLRQTGKTIVSYLPAGGGSREMLIALSAERIILGPQSSISPLGVAVESRYFRRALDRAGVLLEVFARGEFKTAGESLTRDSMSPEQREQLGAILDVYMAELLDSLAKNRRQSMDQARALVDSGPYRAVDAVAKGLADAVGYDDELPQLAPGDGTSRARFVPAATYLALRRVPPRPRRVGLVRIRGPIVSRAPMSFGRMAVDERVIAALRAAREAPVGGVVLLIDSPGGSVLASDRIHHEVLRLAEKKPVVACFGNVAASGGYYIAAGAQAIVAQPTSITGSIGVVSAHVVLAALFQKLGIVTELIKRGARADMLSSSRQVDDGERRAIAEEIDGFYRDFVDVVARGRKRAPEEIEKLARGRVYSGLEAERVGLVDRLGGLDVAIELLEQHAGENLGKGLLMIKPPRTSPKPPEIPAPIVQMLERLGAAAISDRLALALGTTSADRVLAYAGSELDDG